MEGVLNSSSWQATASVEEANLYMLEHEIACDVKFLVGHNSENIDDGLVSTLPLLIHNALYPYIVRPNSRKVEPRKTFLAHRYILITRSPVFEGLFCSGLSESQKGFDKPISISDIEPDAFKEVLTYIYSNCANITMTNVFSLFYASKKYLLGGLEEQCVTFLLDNISQSNVCQMLEHSLFFDNDRLRKQCLRFVALNIVEIVKVREFCLLSKNALNEIMKQDCMAATEVILFNICNYWAEYQCRTQCKNLLDEAEDTAENKDEYNRSNTTVLPNCLPELKRNFQDSDQSTSICRNSADLIENDEGVGAKKLKCESFDISSLSQEPDNLNNVSLDGGASISAESENDIIAGGASNSAEIENEALTEDACYSAENENNTMTGAASRSAKTVNSTITEGASGGAKIKNDTMTCGASSSVETENGTMNNDSFGNAEIENDTMSGGASSTAEIGYVNLIVRTADGGKVIVKAPVSGFGCISRPANSIIVGSNDCFSTNLATMKSPMTDEPTAANYRSALGDVIYRIRFSTLKPDTFAKLYGKSCILTAEEKASIYYDNITHQRHENVNGVMLPGSNLTEAEEDMKFDCEPRYCPETSRLDRFSKVSIDIGDYHQNGGRYVGVSQISFSVNSSILLTGLGFYTGITADCEPFQVKVWITQQNRNLSQTSHSYRILSKTGANVVTDFRNGGVAHMELSEKVFILENRWYSIRFQIDKSSGSRFFGQGGLNVYSVGDKDAPFLKFRFRHDAGTSLESEGQLACLFYKADNRRR